MDSGGLSFPTIELPSMVSLIFRSTIDFNQRITMDSKKLHNLCALLLLGALSTSNVAATDPLSKANRRIICSKFSINRFLK